MQVNASFLHGKKNGRNERQPILLISDTILEFGSETSMQGRPYFSVGKEKSKEWGKEKRERPGVGVGVGCGQGLKLKSTLCPMSVKQLVVLCYLASY